MHNYFQFFGRAVADIELQQTPNGKTVGELRIAVRREFKNSNGEYDTDFFKISLWEGIATNCEKYCKKGDKLLVSGRIGTSKYQLADEKYLNIIELIGEKISFIESVKH